MAQKKYLDNTGLSRFLDNIIATFSKKGHTHTKSQITDFAHNHDERYYTESEIDSKLSDKANATDLTSHTGNTTIHITAAERSAWNVAKAHADSTHAPSNAEPNQNAFSNIKVGNATVAADTKTDTLTLIAGGNVTLTPDATNDSVTIAAKDTTYGEATTSNGGLMSAADKIKLDAIANGANKTTVDAELSSTSTNPVQNKVVNSALSGKVPNTRTVNGKSLSANVSLTASDVGASASGHTHDDRYYTETEIDDKLNGKAAKSHTHTADDITSVNASAITGVIAAAQLPSYVDDVLEYNGTANFPKTGEAGKIYTDTSTNKIYRWGGSGYVVISDTIALGENSSTAYRGDRGKIAYDHSQVTSGNPHNVTKAEVGLGDVDNTADADKSVKNAATANSATKLATSRKLMTKLDATSAASFDGSADANSIGVTGTLPVSNGGTGATSVGEIRHNIGIDPVTTTGTGAAYAANVNGIISLSVGANFIMVPHTQSTVTNPTLNVNNLGAKTIRVQLSNSSSTAVPPAQSNFLGPNRPVEMIYNGTMWVAQLIRPDSNGIYGQVPITSGGTNADTAEQARINLGITTTNNTVLSQNADYAEVGEWADGNSSNEDRIGYFVAIDNSSAGATMVKSSSTSDVRGVTVAAPAFSGNCSSDKFDSDGALLKQYDYVAVMGMVSVIDNGKCTINGRCMPTDDGTAVPSPNNMGYQVISRIDDTHVLIVVEPEADMIARIKSDIEELQDSLPVFSYGTDKPTSNTGGCFYIQYS